MRCLHCTKLASSAVFFSVLVLVMTGCGLGVAGELVPGGDARAGEQRSEDASIPVLDATDSGTGIGSGDPGDASDPGDPSDPNDPIADAASPRPPRADAAGDPHDAGDGSAPEASVEAGPSSHGTMACPPANDASTCDVGTSICCTCPNCSVPFPTICLPVFPGCVPGGVYAALTCGSTANCPSGAQCCASFDSTSKLTGSSCKSSCTGGTRSSARTAVSAPRARVARRWARFLGSPAASRDSSTGAPVSATRRPSRGGADHGKARPRRRAMRRTHSEVGPCPAVPFSPRSPSPPLRSPR